MRDISELKGKIFRHFKGDLYLLEDFVINSETQEKMVPYKMFIEEVPKNKVNPTGQRYRFQEIIVESKNI